MFFGYPPKTHKKVMFSTKKFSKIFYFSVKKTLKIGFFWEKMTKNRKFFSSGAFGADWSPTLQVGGGVPHPPPLSERGGPPTSPSRTALLAPSVGK